MVGLALSNHETTVPPVAGCRSLRIEHALEPLGEIPAGQALPQLRRGLMQQGLNLASSLLRIRSSRPTQVGRLS